MEWIQIWLQSYLKLDQLCFLYLLLILVVNHGAISVKVLDDFFCGTNAKGYGYSGWLPFTVEHLLIISVIIRINLRLIFSCIRCHLNAGLTVPLKISSKHHNLISSYQVWVLYLFFSSLLWIQNNFDPSSGIIMSQIIFYTREEYQQVFKGILETPMSHELIRFRSTRNRTIWKGA